MNNDTRAFYSKIILFGEYSIVRDSRALALPFSLYEGRLKFSKDINSPIHEELKAFAKFLSKTSKANELPLSVDTASFDFDVSNGMIFDSTIPQGYGVGSSGALCAAVYEKYRTILNDKTDIKDLKNVFAVMESYFHGKSSGIDPLISYLNQSILLEKNKIETVNIPKLLSGNGAIFLLNTGRPRRTEPLVNLFLEKCNVKEFSNLCDNVLTPINNRCIDNFLDNDMNSLYEFFRELSDFQYRHFAPMIPNMYKDLWKNGIENENYYLKLCGAGGGGFILGMTRNFNETRLELREHQVRPLFRF